MGLLETRASATTDEGKSWGTSRLRIVPVLLAVAAILAPRPVTARAFRVGEVDGLFGLTLSYGLLARVEDRDDDLIAVANGGSALSANFDDGDLNYGKGVVSNMVRGTADLTLKWRNFGAYVRAFGFYDFENGLGERARTDLTRRAKEVVAWDVDARDYYLSAQFRPWGMPLQLRAGNQVISWGESRVLRTGVDIVNPIDLVAITQPASTPRDLRLPQGMLWGAVQLTSTIAIEAFYQYDWKAVRLPPVGSYFSNNDALDNRELNVLMAGGGQFSDQGTDLDAAFGLPPGTLGFDQDFMQIPAAGRNKPSEGGQFGFTVQAILPEWNATKLALHFVNYHSRLPMISAITANQNAIDATSAEAVEARAEALAAIYESTGLSPDEAEEKGAASAALLTLGEFANETLFKVDYPENIRMLGLSFNTALIRTGTLLSGEISHQFGYPYQINPEDVLAGAFSVIEFDPSFGEGPLGDFGPNEVVKGYVELDSTQLEIGLSQLFGPRLGAAQTLLTADFAWIHVHDIPNGLRLTAPGVRSTDSGHFPTEDSFGYRLIGAASYNSVLGAINVNPRLIFSHDVTGVTPGPLGAFIENRMILSPGVGLEYRNTWTADLSYTAAFGASRFDTLHDRDWVRLNLSYFY